MARGVFPPHYPFLPDVPLTYHYGYDIVAALARRATGARLTTIFDAASTVLFAAYFLVTGAVVRRHAGGRVAPWAVAAALVWMGGLAWLRFLGQPDLAGTRLAPLIGIEPL